MSFWENWVSLFHITELLIYLLSVSISSSSSIYLSIHHLPIYHLSVIYHWSIICFSEDKMPIIPSVTNPFSHLLLSHSHSVPHFFSTFLKKIISISPNPNYGLPSPSKCIIFHQPGVITPTMIVLAFWSAWPETQSLEISGSVGGNIGTEVQEVHNIGWSEKQYLKDK